MNWMLPSLLASAKGDIVLSSLPASRSGNDDRSDHRPDRQAVLVEHDGERVRSIELRPGAPQRGG